MGEMNGRKFRKIILKYNCNAFVLKQIRDSVIPNFTLGENIVFENCLLKLVDHSKRVLFRPRRTRYFHIDFFMTYFMSGLNDLFFEIDFRDIEEISGADYERRKAILPEEEILREAKRIINPSFRLRITDL